MNRANRNHSDAQAVAESDAAAESELVRRVDAETLQRLQERFARLGAVTVCIGDPAGRPLTRPTWGSRYSELIGTSPAGREAFQVSLRACARQAGTRVPSICHEGLSLYAAHIRYSDTVLGVIVVGSRPTAPANREAVYGAADRYGVGRDELWQSAGKVDPYRGGRPEDIHAFADVLADIIATLYGQADRIERQLEDLRAVHSFTELLTGTRDLNEILDLTVKRVVEVMPVKAAAIRLLNEETGELELKAVQNLSEAYLQKGPILLDENRIDALAFAGETVYIADAPNDPRTRYPENARREGIVSGLCVPLAYRGQTVGVIRVYTGERYTFTPSEEALLRSIGSQAAAAVIVARLWTAHLDSERVQHQVEAAAQIQHRMLPASAPGHPTLDIGCVYDPTLQLGGDLYDFFRADDGGIRVGIADVVGKGLPAALLMASLRAVLRCYGTMVPCVADVMAAVNQHMCRDTTVSEFATLVYGRFAPDGRSLTYTNAGHLPPLLLRGDAFRELDTGGIVVGIDSDARYDENTIALRPGDILVMTTDGVTEAMDYEGRVYGRERLTASIRRHKELPARQLARQILWDVRRFAGLAEQSDDITVAVVKVRA